MQVHHEPVSGSDPGCVARTAALKPDSVSWSNVAEYMQPQAPHHLAQPCGLPPTRHLLHAMHWITSVKGAFVLDYIDAPTGKSSAAIVQQRCRIAKNSYKAIAAFLDRSPRVRGFPAAGP